MKAAWEIAVGSVKSLFLHFNYKSTLTRDKASDGHKLPICGYVHVIQADIT